MGEEGKPDAQLFQLLSNLLLQHYISFVHVSIMNDFWIIVMQGKQKAFIASAMAA
ncbi:hypothetical protein DEO72_LG6g605 [Vigna unguiculata]|uniref:Uncharacterized protein n=1 Tax=Vigna unguiculata TaxID=3917 RepID=A0A4D6M5P8_VIGUN|nr:hypothetical protein DEO72_LG6g605 [Vigna unguiculata]